MNEPSICGFMGWNYPDALQRMYCPDMLTIGHTPGGNRVNSTFYKMVICFKERNDSQFHIYHDAFR